MINFRLWPEHLEMPNMNDDNPDPEFKNRCSAIVQASSRITPESTDEVRQLVLRIDEPAFRFVEGQSIGVLVPGPHEFGNKYHHRRYSIANPRQAEADRAVEIDLLVKRCFYIDEISGERYPGVASNYLCDLNAGDQVTVTGPYRSPFVIPQDETSNLLMIGTGTGIAPFRSFVKRIYDQLGGWKGEVRLFYGAKTGFDLIYMNQENDDLANYYDQETFFAFGAFGKRPLTTESDGLEQALNDNIDDAWSLMQDPKTHVFLAGLEKTAPALDRVMANSAGTAEAWQRLKQKIVDDGRWSELLYH